MVDHVPILISIPPKYAVSQVMGYLKGKSAIHIARTYAGKRRNFVGQHFWARGYWVFTVGRDEAAVRLYLQQQEQEDQRLDQLGLFGAEGRFERFTFSSLRLCRRSLTRGYNDSKWEQASAGFGSANFTNRPVCTAWTSLDIWLHREVALAGKNLHDLALKSWHESDVEFYLNGVLAVKTGGRNADYDDLNIKPEAETALKARTELDFRSLQTEQERKLHRRWVG